MKTPRVVFRPAAEDDLFGLYEYIAAEAGRSVAGSYTDRLEGACLSLSTFSERGTRRDDLRPGLRTIGFERRATILFQVDDIEVTVARILYGGRDYLRALERVD